MDKNAKQPAKEMAGIHDTVMMVRNLEEKLTVKHLAEALYQGTPHLQNLAEKLARQHGKAGALTWFNMMGEDVQNFYMHIAQQLIDHAAEWLPNEGSACMLSEKESKRLKDLPRHPALDDMKKKIDLPKFKIPAKILPKDNTLEEAALCTISMQFQGLEQMFMEMGVDGFAAYCHSQASGGIGMRIRNFFSLNNPESPMALELKKKYGAKAENADDCSDILLRAVYHKVRKMMQDAGVPGIDNP